MVSFNEFSVHLGSDIEDSGWVFLGGRVLATTGFNIVGEGIMARIRRVGKYATFTPPTFLGGVSQVVNLWGDSSGATPPRIVYSTRKEAIKAASSYRYYCGKTAKVSLGEDVKRIGNDIHACMQRYDRQLPPETVERISQVIRKAD